VKNFAQSLRVLGAAALLAALAPGCHRASISSGYWATDPAPASACFQNDAVAADHPQASAAGARVLARGGNAVDAAVATAFALSVVRPESCGIGGGGFMLIHLVKDPHAPAGGAAGGAVGDQPLDVVIDFRERAPASARADMFESLPTGASEHSGHAVAIPGTVAGLLFALEQYGTIGRAEAIAPAIDIAEHGFAPDGYMRHAAGRLAEFLDKHPGRPGAGADGREMHRVFIDPVLNPGDAPPTNLAQARVLRRIGEQGAPGFYQGETARAIVSAVARHGGGLTLADLASYRPKVIAPLRGAWRGRTVVTMPLPSSGGVTLLQTLSLMDLSADRWETGATPAAFDSQTSDTGDPALSPAPPAAYWACLSECFKHAFCDRALYLGDPEFMPLDPTQRLLDPARLRAKALLIDPARTLDAARYTRAAPMDGAAGPGASDDHGTSHFSVVDRWGNAVACTQTINLNYGSKIPVPAHGFALNNQMDDFQTRRGAPNAFGLVQSDRNLPEPGKRPLSSMVPTIVLDAGGRVEAVVGASGGPRIITATVQALMGALALNQGDRTVSLPRVHHQWSPDRLEIETLASKSKWTDLGSALGEVPQSDIDASLDADRWWGDRVGALRGAGNAVCVMPEPAVVQLILRNPGGRGWVGACDPRKGGSPRGE